MSSGSVSASKILITGPTGNLGLPLARALAADHDVWGLARFSDRAVRASLEDAGVRCVVGDLGAGIPSALPDDFDFVFHAAALIPMASERDMGHTFTVNTQATAQLFADCRPLRTFVLCSTAGVYRHQPRALVEGDEYGTDVPAYAMSKIAAEQMVRYLSSSTGTPAVILRIGALYGPDGGSGGATAPIDRMLDGKEIWVNPAEPRGVSLLWEDDAVRLATRALQAGESPPLVLNFAGQEQVSVEEYCSYAGRLLGIQPRFRYTDAAYPANPLDTTRMTDVLGPCHTTWREGIKAMLQNRCPELLECHQGGPPPGG
jgi:UDP-glucuronate 4-epimerase